MGPPIESYFGNLTISESFSHNKPVGVDFSSGDTLKFSAEFSIQAEFNINIVGRTSGANFNIDSEKRLRQVFASDSSISYSSNQHLFTIVLKANEDLSLRDEILVLDFQLLYPEVYSFDNGIQKITIL